MHTFRSYLSQKLTITDEQWELMLQHFFKKEIKKGDFLLRQGDVCNYTFFVDKGLLRSFTIDENGKESILQFAPENWFISDRSSIYYNHPSDLFIDALEDTEVIFLKMDFIENITHIIPAFSCVNDDLLQRHIYFMQKRIILLLSATAQERYLNFIELYPELMLRVPQWMIASYLGITPESLSRVRKDLATKHFKPQK